MELLKVGDNLYSKKLSSWGDDIYYEFATVERLTKTQAILSNNTRLVNQPIQDFINSITSYRVFGGGYSSWRFETPKISEEAAKEEIRQKIVRWFNNRKFSEKEKFTVYKTFENLGQLDAVKNVNS